ncbi:MULTISPECIES: serine hydrolase domain-containing protein [unclassified Modestobacter]
MTSIRVATGDGMSAERLSHLESVVQADVDAGLYYGASIKIARHGELALDLALGHADAAATRPIRPDSVFSIFSLTKTFVNILTLRAIERGQFALTTRMVELVPEFSGQPRERATIFHFLTHTNGLPGLWEIQPGMHLDRLDDVVAAACERVHGTVEPGARCDYSPMVNHALLGEALRRTDPQGRSITDILQQDLFDPLGMVDTALGIKAHMRDRHVVPDMRGLIPVKVLSGTTPGAYGLFEAESNEATWVGAASTTGDVLRIAEMLRNLGGLEGARILSPRSVKIARRNWTGDLPNELYRAVALRAGYAPPPAYLGLGFNVRGERIVRHQLGTLTSPETFGNYGAGSAVYWVEPELDLTFVGLTAGVLSQAANIDRFQRLADIAVSAAL